MGVLGEMFPSRKLLSEAGEAGDGNGWRLGPIDLDAGVVEVHRVAEVHGPETGTAADGQETTAPPHPRTPPSP